MEGGTEEGRGGEVNGGESFCVIAVVKRMEIGLAPNFVFELMSI